MNPINVEKYLKRADEIQARIVKGLPTNTSPHPPLKPWQVIALAESKKRLEALK